ncbi:MAG TPA: glycerol-3-phosphate dehydrogenase/oxidase [Streptosporangiaceae bacterium]|jgi:glycerol-3-phosphate dehydrogenase|nr:glycerol-3-phosphate dehydrogenase/oxidase [Streptosporangiaceae bacterium]
MPNNGRIDARDRAAVLERLGGAEFDLLVIGGGITGVGTALDAASRGLRVALVEARDLASGTSSRSSKLIHGGLRYLEQFDFKLVWEALRERDLLVSKLAPHLVKPVSFLYPLHRKVLERPYVGAGLVLYDAMEGTKRPVPHHRHLTVRGALRLAPGVKPAGLAGALLYYDAQTDDARYTVTVARTAAAHGALIANRVSARELLRDDASGGRVVGARVQDEESGRELEVRAKRVVLCAGVWTDLVHELGGIQAGYKVRMSKGVHLVVPYEAIRSDTGIILRTEKSVLFIIPWGQRWIVGTTDTDWTGDRAEPTATSEDIDYILEHANRILARPLTRADVIGVYAGLRPLIAADDSKPTTKLSREHVVDTPVPGLASIAGGKFTTYRLMARDVVDAAVADYERWVPASVTDQLPLLGADGLAAAAAEAERLAEDYGLPSEAVEHLLDRYGTLTEEVLELTRDDPALARPLADGHPYLGAEVAYAVTHEGALHVEDVLVRRVRLFIETGARGAEAVGPVTGIMGGLLGWDAARRAAETERYLELLEADTRALHELTSVPAVERETAG